MSNILLTCAGRRNYLVDYFRQALAGHGEVIAVDSSAFAPALQEADRAFIVPRVSDPEYMDLLVDLCRAQRVRLLFSLNDLELPLLARQRERFLTVGTIPVVSAEEVIDLCFDKLRTAAFLKGLGIPVPKTYATLEDVRQELMLGELQYPLVIKPRWGSASIGIEYVESFEELEMSWKLGMLRVMRGMLAAPSSVDQERCLLVQQRLTGTEYGLDVVNDLEGRYVCTFVRRKLAMRSGETDHAVTESHPLLEDVGRRIGEALGHVGNLDCDVFVDGETYRVLELNPRFGGGYPFSHAAGANLPAALVAWARGEDADPRWLTLRAGVTLAKCDRLVEVVAFGRVGSGLREDSKINRLTMQDAAHADSRSASLGESVVSGANIPVAASSLRSGEGI